MAHCLDASMPCCAMATLPTLAARPCLPFAACHHPASCLPCHGQPYALHGATYLCHAPAMRAAAIGAWPANGRSSHRLSGIPYAFQGQPAGQASGAPILSPTTLRACITARFLCALTQIPCSLMAKLIR